MKKAAWWGGLSLVCGLRQEVQRADFQSCVGAHLGGALFFATASTLGTSLEIAIPAFANPLVTPPHTFSFLGVF